MNESKRQTRIEICGGIASGKTTFANLLNQLEIELVFENFRDNPFWKAFYANPGKYIFETETTFTLLHYHQIKKQIEKKSEVIICDFSFSLDLAYAKIGLNGSQLHVFEKVYKQIYKELGLSNLLVYLKCDAETEHARIIRRRRSEENLITIDFLDRLNKAIDGEMLLLHGKCPVIIIDSSVKNFLTDEKTKEEMKELIRNNIKRMNLI